MSEGEQGSGRSGNSLKGNSPSSVEWIVGAIALLLVLVGIGLLVHGEWETSPVPPVVSIEGKRVMSQPGGGYLVEFVVFNRGSVTVRGLTVEGRLLDLKGGEEGGRSTTTFTWVPSRAEGWGGLFFSHDPREYRLEIKPGGYERP